MEQLWITLPAIAPDYSGVCSAMFDLGGMSIIHDASGCTGNYTGYDEPRWYGSDSMVYCSGLREIDAVLGRDDKLIDNVLKTAEYKDPTCISVIGSPVPMVIGSDMRGIAHEIESLTGLPAFGFSTNGLGLYNKGVSDAIIAVIKRFIKPCAEKLDKGINVIGTTPIDFSANSNAEDIYDLLKNAGYKVLGKLMMGCSISQIENLSMAQVNLVVSESGLNAARYLYENYKIPYVAGMFTGTDNSELLELIELSRKDGQNRVLGQSLGNDASEPAADKDEKKVLIIGEQILGNSIRRAVAKKDSKIKIVVGTMTGLRKELANEGDLDITSEEKLIEIMDSGYFSKIVGDPLFGDLLDAANNIKIVEVPHVALSSKLYWNQYIHYMQKEMDDIIGQILA